MSDAPGSLSALITKGPSTSEPLSEISPRILHAIRKHLGMDVSFISHLSEGRRVFRFVDVSSEDSPIKAGDSDPLDQSYCKLVVEGRLPELMHDARELPAALEIPATTELPVGAHLSVPIRLREGEVYGTFCCFSHLPDRTLTDRDLAVMRVFAEMIADQIDKERDVERANAEIRERVRRVTRGEGLTMAYQPIVQLDTGTPAGFEALARFSIEPVRGPEAWFDEALEVGLGTELDIAAINAALTALAHLPTGIFLSINATPATVASGQLEEILGSVWSERIVLEITEHASIASYDDLVLVLANLKPHGLRLAVDDAGAGYASFRHILRLRPEFIKLDMSITRDIDSDPAKKALASALVSFSRDTGSALIAEGVETSAELKVLRELGVTLAQGYFFGRPSPTKQAFTASAFDRRLV